MRINAENDERVSHYDNETASGDGHWFHLAPGWINAWDETHAVHEDTLAECISAMQFKVKRCYCDECSDAVIEDLKSEK